MGAVERLAKSPRKSEDVTIDVDGTPMRTTVGFCFGGQQSFRMAMEEPLNAAGCLKRPT